MIKGWQRVGKGIIKTSLGVVKELYENDKG